MGARYFDAKYERDAEDERKRAEAARRAAAATDVGADLDPKSQLEARMASSLSPDLQARYKERREQAIAQQKANYQAPEAVQALGDSQRQRSLLSGLQSAANKFGSVGGDGGQKSGLDKTFGDMNAADEGAYKAKNQAYQQGLAAEDEATTRPLQLEQEAIRTQRLQAEEANLDRPIDALTRESLKAGLKAQNIPETSIPWERVTYRMLERNPAMKAALQRGAKQVPYRLETGRDPVTGKPTWFAIDPSNPTAPPIKIMEHAFAPQQFSNVFGDHFMNNGGTVTPLQTGGTQGAQSPPASMPALTGSSSGTAPQTASAAVTAPDANGKPVQKPGQRDYDFKNETEIWKSKQESVGRLEAKDANELQAAGAKQYVAGEMTNRMRSLYKNAGKFFGILPKTGPIGGAMTQKVNQWGYSAGPNANKLNIALMRETNNYIHEITGANMGPKEEIRLMAALPKIGQEPELFENQLEEYEAEVKKIVEQKMIEAGRHPARVSTQGQGAPEAHAAPAKRRVYVPGGL